MRVLLIDNYDSFTYNLVQRMGELDTTIDILVIRNDKTDVQEIRTKIKPDRILLSPGPCTPAEAGVCNEIIPAFRGLIPILGVCLGHQCIGAQHGMTIRRADTIMHGKTSQIYHDEKGIFSGLPNPFTATRYHSLIVDRDTIPLDKFEISAWTDDDIVMGLRWIPTVEISDTRINHRSNNTTIAPLEGVQFHPESFLTDYGPCLIANFLGLPHPTITTAHSAAW